MTMLSQDSSRAIVASLVAANDAQDAERAKFEADAEALAANRGKA